MLAACVPSIGFPEGLDGKFGRTYKIGGEIGAFTGVCFFIGLLKFRVRTRLGAPLRARDAIVVQIKWFSRWFMVTWHMRSKAPSLSARCHFAPSLTTSASVVVNLGGRRNGEGTRFACSDKDSLFWAQIQISILARTRRPPSVEFLSRLGKERWRRLWGSICIFWAQIQIQSFSAATSPAQPSAHRIPSRGDAAGRFLRHAGAPLPRRRPRDMRRRGRRTPPTTPIEGTRS